MLPLSLVLLLGLVGSVNAFLAPNTVEWIPSGGGVITFQEDFNSSNATISDLVLFRDFSWGNTKYNIIGWGLTADSSMIVNSMSDTLIQMTLNISGEKGTLTIYIPEKTVSSIDNVDSWSWENGFVVATVKGSMLLGGVPVIVYLSGGSPAPSGDVSWLLWLIILVTIFLIVLAFRR